MYKLSQRSLSRLQGVETKLLAIIIESIQHSPHDFGIPQHGGLRTAEEQKLLYNDGKSQLDGTIKKSYHQTGKAFDIYGYVNGTATWNIEILTEIATHIIRLAKDRYNIKITWGGSWTNFKDYVHFQIR